MVCIATCTHIMWFCEVERFLVCSLQWKHTASHKQLLLGICTYICLVHMSIIIMHSLMQSAICSQKKFTKCKFKEFTDVSEVYSICFPKL